jgi:hypothetical protein
VGLAVRGLAVTAKNAKEEVARDGSASADTVTHLFCMRCKRESAVSAGWFVALCGASACSIGGGVVDRNYRVTCVVCDRRPGCKRCALKWLFKLAVAAVLVAVLVAFGSSHKAPASPGSGGKPDPRVIHVQVDGRDITCVYVSASSGTSGWAIDCDWSGR